MQILVTNDDGISAPGLAVLEKIAAEIAGPDGKVWVLAPAFEQSGVAHCISYTRPYMFQKISERRFAIEGSPADCVMAGLHQLVEGPVDLVLSGVNRGNNCAENAPYSGTLGAAMEGALQGVKSIGLSQFMGPKLQSLETPFEAAERYGAQVVQKILTFQTENPSPYQLFYNVNFPPCSADEVRGIRAATQGLRSNIGHIVEPMVARSGRKFLSVQGGAQDASSAPGSDVAVNLDGFISVTPMRADFTAHDVMAKLAVIDT